MLTPAKLRRLTLFATVVATSIGALTVSVAAQSNVLHALDPLSAAEITRTADIIRASGKATPQTRYGTIVVQPQPKGSSTRAARVIGFDWSKNEGFLAVVDLGARRLESWTVIDSEPPMRLLTIRRAEEIAHADPRWVAAMRARKLDTGRVSVLVGLPERAKLPRQGTDRVVGTNTWLRDGIPNAVIATGLRMAVNLTQGRVESFADAEAPSVGGVDSAAVRAFANPRPPLKQLRIDQPKGASVRVDGNEIQWDRWTLRVGVDPRRGLEVHDVSFQDGARRRSVLHSGSVSEIVAPYGDPAFGTWYPRDEGDYGMGIYSQSSAVQLEDVPANAAFLHATMHDAFGRPTNVPRAIAVYERDGGMLWRHANLSRRGRQLVVSAHSTIDNYDYQFNWIFGQDGEISGEVILSGVMNINPTNKQTDTAHADGHATRGHLVAPGVNAPHHQHFFSYRLDLDVDGVANTVYSMDTRSAAPGSGAPDNEFITMDERPLQSEQRAVSDVSFASSRAWRVANTSTRNALGQFTGFALVPGAVTPAYALEGSAPRRTAGFVAHQLWITPYEPDELYAGGEFQNLGRDNEGLPSWIVRDRPLTDTDVVLWYTLGITHIPRPEDWPYMPAHRGGFRLVPVSFFDRNPALDLPPAKR